MRYLNQLAKALGENLPLGEEEEYNPLDLIKFDAKFRQASSMLVQTVKFFDQKYPDIGADEIFAAILNDAMEHIFPNAHLQQK